MIVVEMRVFPFSFPPIRGGAQGGASPTPIPDPDPDLPLYDLTNVSIVLTKMDTDWQDGTTYSMARYYIAISGIVVNDSSGVSSVKLDVKTLDWMAGADAVDTTKTTFGGAPSLNVADPNQAASLAQMRNSDLTLIGKAVSVSGDATFRAYDADGNVLQEDTITVVGF